MSRVRIQLPTDVVVLLEQLCAATAAAGHVPPTPAQLAVTLLRLAAQQRVDGSTVADG